MKTVLIAIQKAGAEIPHCQSTLPITWPIVVKVALLDLDRQQSAPLWLALRPDPLLPMRRRTMEVSARLVGE
jgi:hypothetical protein